MKPHCAANELVLVTGGAGYIGSVVVRTLLKLGYRVRVFDKLLYGDQGLAAVRERIELLEGDIRCLPRDVYDGVWAIIHLAALSAEPAAEYRPEANHEINTQAAVRVSELAKAAGVSRFIQASSCSIYDVGAGNPERDIVHDEDFPAQPFRVYSISKREAEKGILALADKHFCPTVLRKGSVYGYSPRMRLDLVVNTFVYHALHSGRLVLHNGGEMWRPLLDIRDAAAAYVTVLEAPAEKVSGQIFNVVYGNYRISELALRVHHTLGKIGIPCELCPDYQFRNLRSCQASGKKIADTLGFVPRFSVEEAVADLVEKMRNGVLSHLDDPILHNIRWLDFLEESKAKLGFSESIFDLNADQLRELRVTVSARSSR